jgi:hypothetical protein
LAYTYRIQCKDTYKLILKKNPGTWGHGRDEGKSMGVRAQWPSPQDYIDGAVLLADVAAFLEQQPLPSALPEVLVALAPAHLDCSVEQDFFFLPKRRAASAGVVRANKAAALSKRATFFMVKGFMVEFDLVFYANLTQN